MGRIQVVLSDEVEQKFRQKLANEMGGLKKGGISENIESMINVLLESTQGAFVKEGEFEIGNEALAQIMEFYDRIETLEKKKGLKLLILKDNKTGAIYIECHISAKTLVDNMDLDHPTDPDEYPDFRANRELEESDPAFERMVDDAVCGRQFSDIIIEYFTKLRPERPLKIIGGQHRSVAIKRALKLKSENRYHGVRIYFNLDSNKREEIYEVSNTNIDVPPELLDRLEEENKEPKSKLLNFCWKIGILPENKNFGERRATRHGLRIPVNIMRTFIVGFYKGKEYSGNPKNDAAYPPFCQAGERKNKDKLEYDSIYKKVPDFTEEHDLVEAGIQFVRLHAKQFETVTGMDIVGKKEFRMKAITPGIVSGWSFAAGALQGKERELKRLYELPDMSGDSDPLNINVLHSDDIRKFVKNIDGTNYRGIGTRYGPTERGRITKIFLFYAYSDQVRIDINICRLAIQRMKSAEEVKKADDLERKAYGN